jgi:type IX secretion system PorP/SprF family membrane protein
MKIISGLSMLLLSCFGFSQELDQPVNSKYLADDNFVLSPTFAGVGDKLRLRANGLTQWVGIKDAPKTHSLYADFRIKNRSGIGLSLFNDSNGNTFQMGAKFSFAHHIILDYDTKQYLSFGLSYQINSFKIDVNQFNLTYEIPTIDPSIKDNRANFNFNFDVGLLYRNRAFYWSVIKTNLLPSTNNPTNNLNRKPSPVINYQLYFGYIIKNNSNVEIEPSIYYQLFTERRPSTTDFNIKFRRYTTYGNYYWAGIGYRFTNNQISTPLTISPMAGFKKANLYFGYSYQVAMNQIAAYHSGTHSVTIGFDFNQAISNCPCTRSVIHD